MEKIQYGTIIVNIDDPEIKELVEDTIAALLNGEFEFTIIKNDKHMYGDNNKLRIFIS